MSIYQYVYEFISSTLLAGLPDSPCAWLAERADIITGGFTVAVIALLLGAVVLLAYAVLRFFGSIFAYRG